MKKLTILKIGGKLLDDEAPLLAALTDFSKIEGAKILVHGGGKKSSELSRQLGLEPKLVEGRRITDAATLEVVTMVYAGLLNKQIVAQLQSLGCDAIGLSGADGNAILAKKRPVKTMDYGFVGDVETVNKRLIINFLKQNLTPVFCAVTHDGQGQLLNTNADTIATALAVELAGDFEVSLKFCFEKNGVLLDPSDDDLVIPRLDAATYTRYKSEGIISDGMIPKLENAFAAAAAGVAEVVICGRGGISPGSFQKGTLVTSALAGEGRA